MEILELFTRRSLLMGLGVAGAGAATTGGFSSLEFFRKLLRPNSGGRKNVQLATAEFNDWSLQIGSQFTTHTGHELKLTDVQAFTDRRDRPDALRDRAFVARFKIEKGGEMGPDLYNVRHPSGGTFMMRFDPSPEGKPLEIGAVFG